MEQPDLFQIVRFGGGQGICPQKSAQEESVLSHIALKHFAFERAIGQPSHERMFEAVLCNVCVLLPQ
jgi:hypothetical protein